jgi:hypothetical protein
MSSIFMIPEALSLEDEELVEAVSEVPDEAL